MADSGDKGAVPLHVVASKDTLPSTLLGTNESGCASSASAHLSLTDYKNHKHWFAVCVAVVIKFEVTDSNQV